MGYYFSHVEEDGSVVDYYPGSEGFEILNRGLRDQFDHYGAAPGSISLDRPDLVGVETYALSPIESSTGLKGILLEVLGPYDTIVTQYRYQQGSNQYYTYVNDISPDYPWLASALLFIVLLWALFGILRRGIWNQ